MFPKGLAVKMCEALCVVYKSICAGCNASYIGETYRHFSTSVRENLVTVDPCNRIHRGSGFRIPTIWIPDSDALDSGFQIKFGFRIPSLWIPDSNNQILPDSGFRILLHGSTTDKASHILKHLNSNHRCKSMSSSQCFKVNNYAESPFQLKIKEALHILWDKPILNQQVKHVNLKLFL